MIQQEPLLRAEGQSARINECWLSEGQASYLEKPKDRLVHLVEERNALYEKSGSAGSGFLSRGNPKIDWALTSVQRALAKPDCVIEQGAQWK